MKSKSNGLNGAPQITWFNIVITLGLVATLAGGAWALFQSQLSNLEQQMRQGDASLSADIKDNRAEAERLRNDTVSRPEHTEFVKRIDDDLSSLQRRLEIIEATRPTTGELQSAAASLRDQMNEIKDRTKFLEQAPRPTVTQMPPTH